MGLIFFTDQCVPKTVIDRNFQNVARIANSQLIMQAYKFTTKFTIKCRSYSTSSMMALEISEI